MKNRLTLSLSLFALLCVHCPASSRAVQPSAQPQQELQTYTNSIGMEFVRIPAGLFTRASTTKNAMNEEQEQQSTFIINKAFYLGKYPVTQEQWMAVMGKNPSFFKGQTHPVETVS